MFVSAVSVANFVSSDPMNMGAFSMLQALFGVNTLVNLNTKYLTQQTLMTYAILLAIVINAMWLTTGRCKQARLPFSWC